MMNHLLVAFVLLFGAPVAEDPMVEARTLFQEGTVKYDSANYNGAINDFTEALSIVAAQDGDDHVRLSLLFNIAMAHEKAFKIDQDVTHLRQALDLYERYSEFTRTKSDLTDDLDVQSRLIRLRRQLSTHNQIQRNRENAEEPQTTLPPPPEGSAPAPMDWKKPRTAGLSLVIGGGAMTIGGVVLTALGSQLEGDAQAQVDGLGNMGVPADHPAWAEGEAFVASEKSRGNALMGVGIPVAVIGAAGVGLGTYYLIKSKRLREGRVSAVPAFSPGFAGVTVSGRF